MTIRSKSSPSKRDKLSEATLIALRAANFYIIAARFNQVIVDDLIKHAMVAFDDYQIPLNNVHTIRVPGAFEIPLAARLLASRGLCDAIIAFGCVIRGETAHFDSVANACTSGLARVAQDFTIPVAHGVLLTYDYAAAQKRTIRGRKVAEAAIEMLALAHQVDARTP